MRWHQVWTNRYLLNSAGVDWMVLVRFIAPIEEEIFKGLILLFLVRRKQFTYFVDGAGLTWVCNRDRFCCSGKLGIFTFIRSKCTADGGSGAGDLDQLDACHRQFYHRYRHRAFPFLSALRPNFIPIGRAAGFRNAACRIQCDLQF